MRVLLTVRLVHERLSRSYSQEPRGGPRVVDLGFQCTQTRLRPGGEAASTGSNELAEPVLEPLVAEPSAMPLLHHGSIFKQRLAHDG